MRVYHLSSLNLRSIDADSRLHRNLAFIAEHQRKVRTTDLTDAMLKEWTAGSLAECLPEVTAARYALPILFAFTPDDKLLPVKVFVYTYEHYCRNESHPNDWLDEWTELRFVQFQYLLRLIRLGRDIGESVPSFDLFDFGNYDRMADEAATLDRKGGYVTCFRFSLTVSTSITNHVDCFGKVLERT